MTTPNLDDPQVYRDFDPEGMLARVRELPGQCQQAWQTATGFGLPASYKRLNKVVILSMGGSAIGGDLVRSLVEAEAKVPVFVHRDYHLPAFVDARTLVVASSYSGNTEEVLSSFGEALKTGAKKLAITTGGKLKALAEANDVPVFSFSYKAPPRAALGFSLMPLLCFLQRLGLMNDTTPEVAEMVSVLQEMCRRLDERVSVSDNPAKQLAQRLYGHLPVIYGAGVLAEVAHRWKTQLNENSKACALDDVFPELCHNTVVGYRFPPELARKIRVVMLRAPFEERIRLRYHVVSQLLEQAGIGYESVDATGSHPLSQMMSLVLFGDYVSCYLALLHGIDPSPVAAIDYLKTEMARE